MNRIFFTLCFLILSNAAVASSTSAPPQKPAVKEDKAQNAARAVKPSKLIVETITAKTLEEEEIKAVEATDEDNPPAEETIDKELIVEDADDTVEAENDEPVAPQPAITFDDTPDNGPQNYIGTETVVETKFEDTLMQLGRQYNVGYVEMVAANPGIDPILPGEGQRVVIPQRHLLPDASREGLVINLAEMRMYNFTANPNRPTTHPIGIGRDGLNTPLGITTIVRKKEGPSWRPTERMRKEKPELPAVVEPGPDNPLGTHALYLGWPQYLIHGTHKPLGVGRRVSSGCMRMYPEDIIQIYRDIPVGTQVNVIKQPIKLAWIDDMLFIEAHAEDDLADTIEAKGKIGDYRVPETLFSELKEKAGDAYPRLNWQTIREAVKNRDGRPIAILYAPDDENNLASTVADETNPLLLEEESSEDDGNAANSPNSDGEKDSQPQNREKFRINS